MREVVIYRSIDTKDVMLGNLFVIDGTKIIYQCKTLELPWRNNKRNVSCVPEGIYPLRYEYSPRFKQDLWELYNVPGRSECKFHAANFARQLNGCIALGDMHLKIDSDDIPDIRNSRITMERFHKSLSGLDVTQLHIINRTKHS